MGECHSALRRADTHPAAESLLSDDEEEEMHKEMAADFDDAAAELRRRMLQSNLSGSQRRIQFDPEALHENGVSSPLHDKHNVIETENTSAEWSPASSQPERRSQTTVGQKPPSASDAEMSAIEKRIQQRQAALKNSQSSAGSLSVNTNSALVSSETCELPPQLQKDERVRVASAGGSPVSRQTHVSNTDPMKTRPYFQTGEARQRESGEGSSTSGRQNIRSWLSSVDLALSVYASTFEQEGFQAVSDVAELDENEVEEALEALGVQKFAHKAKIRRAIAQLQGR